MPRSQPPSPTSPTQAPPQQLTWRPALRSAAAPCHHSLFATAPALRQLCRSAAWLPSALRTPAALIRAPDPSLRTLSSQHRPLPYSSLVASAYLVASPASPCALPLSVLAPSPAAPSSPPMHRSPRPSLNPQSQGSPASDPAPQTSPPAPTSPTQAPPQQLTWRPALRSAAAQR